MLLLAAFPRRYYPAAAAIQSCHLIRSGLDCQIQLSAAAWRLRSEQQAVRCGLPVNRQQSEVRGCQSYISLANVGIQAQEAAHKVVSGDPAGVCWSEQNVELELSKRLLSIRIRFRCDGYRTLTLELECRVHLPARLEICHGPPESFQVFHSQ
jgi:hypothetical protein